jgi:hypothetical protein
MKHIILMCVDVLCLIACKEKAYRKHTVIEGKVLDFQTNAPIKGINIILKTEHSSGWLGNSASYSIDNTIDVSDANGCYCNKFKALPGENYRLETGITDGYMRMNGINNLEIDKINELGRKVKKNIYLISSTIVKFNFKKDTAGNKLYSINSEYLKSISENANGILVNSLKHDTSILGKAKANYLNSYKIVVYENGIGKSTIIEKYTPKSDTTEININ